MTSKHEASLKHGLWYHTATERFDAPIFEGEMRCELGIIGGGFTGLSAALHAAKSGVKTVFFEAGMVGQGGSGRNVGLVNAGLWLPPDEINERLGEEKGAALYALLAGAPEKVFALIDEFGITCEATRKGTLHVAHKPPAIRELEARLAQAKVRGAPVELLSKEETQARLGSESAYGALFDPRAGTIQPLSYVWGLARAAHHEGARIFEQSAVMTIEKEGDIWRVRTKNGTLLAQKLLLCVNAYGDLPKAQTHTRVHYFQAATTPLSAAQRAGILEGGEGAWDTATIMSSFRLDQGGRLIIGGMGRSHGVGSAIHLAWVKRKMERLFPALKGVDFEHFWQGRIAMSDNYLPQIQQIGQNALTISGYSGRGIGPGTVFGALLANAILRGDTSDLPLPISETKTRGNPWLRSQFFDAASHVAHLIS